MMLSDRLGQAKARPALVENAVRTALREALMWRIGGGRAPNSEALVAGALATARCSLDVLDCDRAERSRTLAAVGNAARRFASSALCRRLMAVPAAQFFRLPNSPHGPDAIIRDRRGRLHAVVITAGGDAFEAGEIAGRVARATALPRGCRLTPLNVHVFSLASAQRHLFQRDLAMRRIDESRVA
jgi:hypothetical protein